MNDLIINYIDNFLSNSEFDFFFESIYIQFHIDRFHSFFFF